MICQSQARRLQSRAKEITLMTIENIPVLLATLLTPVNFLQALASMVIFAIVGIAVAVVGYKIFDKCTPGDINKEIVENRNVAAAIVAGAVIIGVCIIVATAMIS
jgi:uncharacterized membrane protein YjfL (UPF0719 family)